MCARYIFRDKCLFIKIGCKFSVIRSLSNCFFLKPICLESIIFTFLVNIIKQAYFANTFKEFWLLLHSKCEWPNHWRLTFFLNGKSYLPIFRKHIYNKLLDKSNTAAQKSQNKNTFLSNSSLKHLLIFLLPSLTKCRMSG